MDTSRFDRWTRSLTSSTARRRTIFTLLLGGVTVAAGGNGAAARKKRKRKNKKKRCQAGTKRCGAACIPAETCCSAADCNDQLACIGGTCAIPCGQPCDDLAGVCATSVDGAEVCTGAQLVDILCAASPCTADSQCAADEFCSSAGCPPVGGIANRCQELLLP
jgi:hypothetical protein